MILMLQFPLKGTDGEQSQRSDGRGWRTRSRLALRAAGCEWPALGWSRLGVRVAGSPAVVEVRDSRGSRFGAVARTRASTQAARHGRGDRVWVSWICSSELPGALCWGKAGQGSDGCSPKYDFTADGIGCPPMRGFRSQDSFNDFARSVKSERRFVRTSRQENFLNTVLATSHSRTMKLPQDYSLWRAQLGHEWEEETTNRGTIKHRCSYKPERMKPCRNRAGDGRTNPRGIPCLYMATRKNTAILEVRPLIGSYVSIARFRLSRDIEIINCAKDHFSLLDEDLRITLGKSREEKLEQNEKMVWGEINRAFSQPSQREDESVDYVPTQILAEAFKSKGFGGIAYKSNFGENGFNVALFDLAAADIIGRVRLCRVDRIDIKITTEENLETYGPPTPTTFPG
jgi:hypothetical protein